MHWRTRHRQWIENRFKLTEPFIQELQELVAATGSAVTNFTESTGDEAFRFLSSSDKKGKKKCRILFTLKKNRPRRSGERKKGNSGINGGAKPQILDAKTDFFEKSLTCNRGAPALQGVITSGLESKAPVINYSCSSMVLTHLDVCIPFFLRSEYWKRHRMTRQDVGYILKFASAQHIWICALQYNFPVNLTALKQNMTTWDNTEVSSKCNIHNKLLDTIAKTSAGTFSQGDCVLITPTESMSGNGSRAGSMFLPPVYSVHFHEFTELRNSLIHFPQPHGHVKANYVLRFLECLWVPLKVEKAGVYCEKLHEFEREPYRTDPSGCFSPSGRYEPLRTVHFQGRTMEVTSEGIIVTSLIQ